jgi:predicted acylesterase/phospholipase RssA
MNLGIVLGAGGAFGWAFHLGVLEALVEETGHSISDASRVVGTSAGAAISAAALTGRSRDELLAMVTTEPDAEAMAKVEKARAEIRNPRRFLRPAAPKMAARMLFRDPIVAGMGLGPHGLFPTSPLRRFVADPDVAWPASLWITAVDVATGRTVVFGRERTNVSLPDAIEASGTIPVLMEPKSIDGVLFTDGAVTSATHGYLIAPDAHDLVLVSSPMTRPGRGPVKWRARRHLVSEFEAVRETGTQVVIVEPTAEVVALADGFPRNNPDAGHAVADAARALTREALRGVGQNPVP